jgi:hypothetical protein
METVTPHEVGIHAEDPDRLRERYRISTGLKLLEPQTVERAGYREPTAHTGIIAPIVDAQNPMGSLRLPTDQEIATITATSETKRTMQLVRLPRAVGDLLLEQCIRVKESKAKVEPSMPKHELAPGIIGIPSSTRQDGPQQLHVSVNPSLINAYTGLPPKVGDHIDGFYEPDVSLMVVNMGPGERWHRIAPDVNRDKADRTLEGRYQYIRDHLAPETIPLHWLKVCPPTDDYVEAILNSPVSWTLHEGSTLGCDEPSRAFFCMTEPVALGVYPSIV